MNIYKILQITKVYKKLNLQDFIQEGRLNVALFVSALGESSRQKFCTSFTGNYKTYSPEEINSIVTMFFNDYNAQMRRALLNCEQKDNKDNPDDEDFEEAEREVSDYISIVDVILNLYRIANFDLNQLDFEDAIEIINRYKMNDITLKIETLLENAPEQYEQIYRDTPRNYSALFELYERLKATETEENEI